MVKNVKNTTFVGLFDLIAPHSCRGCGRLGSVICECCKNDIIATHESICPNCKGRVKAKDGRCGKCRELPPIYVVGERQGLLGEIVHSYKYDSVWALAGVLAELLDEILPKEIGDGAVIVPLPTIGKHIRERGLDHTYKIAKCLAKRRKCRVERVLERTGNSVQVGANSAVRKKQASLAYGVRGKAKIESGKMYVLVDDVWTTGASMMAAIKKLREAGAEKIVVALLTMNHIS